MPSELAEENDLAKIRDLDVVTASALSVTVFLNRTKFGAKLDNACKLKAEVDQHEMKGEKAHLSELKEKAKEEFGRLARSYVTHFFKETRSDFNFTTIIAQGLGSFDLEILLKYPLTLATRCYSQLFTAFRLRGYFQLDQESQAKEEYLSFVDELRVKFADLDQPTLLVPDTVSFLLEQSTLPSRTILLQTFRLACLCLDEPFCVMPTVRFGPVNTDDQVSKLFEIVLPVQSYFSNVAGSIETVTSDYSIADFLEMEFTFGRTALSDTYDPWSGLDNFEKTDIMSKLDPEIRSQKKSGEATASQATEVQPSPDTMKYAKKNVRPTRFISDAEISQSAKSLRRSSNKD